MNRDMTVPCADGLITIRVGAIIMRDGKLLMAGNDHHPDYLYTVGGRIKLGETAQDAVIRQVWEQTGVHMEVDRLGFIHENYFIGDVPANLGKLIYEIDFYFYMKVPDHFEPVSHSFCEGAEHEYLKWIDLDDDITYYPTFFRTELRHPVHALKHLVTDERPMISRSIDE